MCFRAQKCYANRVFKTVLLSQRLQITYDWPVGSDLIPAINELFYGHNGQRSFKKFPEPQEFLPVVWLLLPIIFL